ncbi:hypothetical protein ACJJTC_009069 [Scirpophaga incertulas]
MLSRMCIARSVLSSTHTLKSPVPQNLIPKNYIIRNYARETRSRVASKTQPTIWQKLMAPAGPNAFSLGKGALAGASAVGMVALCYYGSGAKPGTLQESQYVIFSYLFTYYRAD